MTRGFVLNDTSFITHAPDVDSARTWMSDLVESVATLVEYYGAERTLRSQQWVDELMLAPDYGISQWRNDGAVDLDMRRFFLQIETKCPLLADLPADFSSAEDEFFVSEFGVDGLPGIKVPSAGVAMLLGWILVSVNSDDPWSRPVVSVIQRQLGPNADGFIFGNAAIQHVSGPAHVGVVGPWLRKVFRGEIQNARECWAAREALYPNLEFCIEVEKQLANVHPEVMEAIVDRLADLDETADRWQKDRSLHPNYGFWMHPESEATIQQYGSQRRFTHPNGYMMDFSLHTRFPGEGRIYFHPKATRDGFIVGYIGPHLNTARFH